MNQAKLLKFALDVSYRITRPGKTAGPESYTTALFRPWRLT